MASEVAAAFLPFVSRGSVTVNQRHATSESEATEFGSESGQFIVFVLILLVSVHKHKDVP